MKHEGRKAGVGIFRKTKLKVWERLVKVKHFDISISNGIVLLIACQ